MLVENIQKRPKPEQADKVTHASIQRLQCVLVAQHGDGAYAVGFSADLPAKGTALRRICTGAH
jgi:hypothetical protein